MLYKLCTSIAFCLFSALVYAQQNNSYQQDLQTLYEILKKTPSYKDQIRGAKKQQYQQLYEQLRNENIRATAFDTLYKLSALLLPIRDNHLSLYETRGQNTAVSGPADTKGAGSLKKYPKASINLDSLEQELSSKPINSIEGIYYQGGDLKVGIYIISGTDSLHGIILSADSRIWERGELALLLRQRAQNRFQGIYANLTTKDLYFVKNDRFDKGTLGLFGSKKNIPITFAHLGKTNNAFQLKTISPNIQYLRLGSFSTSNTALVNSEKFYNEIKDSLILPNLIVDLRNNPGGGFKSSGRFLSLLKGYSKNSNIYALINNRTFSNAEQFVVKLIEFPNVITLGETTNGTLTYGNNRGITETLPSGKYKLYITDMKDRGHFLQYEEVGVIPNFVLNQSNDWIQQVKEFIE